MADASESGARIVLAQLRPTKVAREDEAQAISDLKLKMAELLTLSRPPSVAESVSLSIPVGEYEPNVQAVLCQEMLRLSQEEQGTLSMCSAMIVAYVSRTEVWRYSENEYSCLRDYLRDFEPQPSDTWVSRMNTLGTTIVPYCDTHSIPIDPLLERAKWPHLREAISALRRAVIRGSEQDVRDIVETVASAELRETVREELAKRRERRVRYGRASAARSGKTIMILIACDSEAEVQVLARRLHGWVEWTLTPRTEILPDGSTQIEYS